MPPPYGSGYDPAAGFRAATNPYGARRPRNPWDLPQDWQSWRDYFSPPPAEPLSSRYQYGGVGRSPTPAYNYGNPGAPPAPPTIYADPGQAALYGSTSRPPGYADQPSVPFVGAPAAPPSAADQLLQEFLDWKAINQQNIEDERAQRAYEFDTQQAANRQAALVNAFGTFGQQGAPTGGSAIAQQQAQALDALAKQRQQAFELRNGTPEEAAFAARQAAGPQIIQATPGLVTRPGIPTNPYGAPPRLALYADEVRQAAPYDPHAVLPSRPIPFNLDTSPGGSQGTMLGNAAFGIHTDRGGSVRPAGANPQDFEKFQRMASDTSPEGQAAWQEYEDFVLKNSPRASILARGEDPGGSATAAERAYYRALLRRRGSGR